MQSTKEKLSNMASAAKEHIDIYKAKIDEKAEKSVARTEEEKIIAHERAKAKESQAKMELHEAKARHAAEKLSAKQPSQFSHHDPSFVGAHQHGTKQPAYGAAPAPENSCPLARNYPMNKHI
ncbi:late embryogenesis abundant protein 6-like isoform X3 [Prosopis cineraria]|uniref:late embryogenesis abundant protein 6-like isoform X3 n=1 Tax=Prosopis cineraria TaxID=364024 RepID=UPI00240F1C74|nr:late embryogenesis abundant protein 6-like isoform X3 [Prosopis cineraria]